MHNPRIAPPGRVLTINGDGSHGICTHKRAKEFVRSGRADWDGAQKIVFRRDDARVLAVSVACLAEYVRRANYDRAVTTGLAQDRAMVNVPITRPDIALQRGQRSYGCGPLHRH